LAESDDAGDEPGGSAVREPGGKGPVELDFGDREAVQLGEGGIPGAEVVD
jgi:hypothetical protein